MQACQPFVWVQSRMHVPLLDVPLLDVPLLKVPPIEMAQAACAGACMLMGH